LQLHSTELKKVADALPRGGDKDALLNRVRAMNDAWRVIDSWASSPGLKAPR
jgi:hypothetical protein